MNQSDLERLQAAMRSVAAGRFGVRLDEAPKDELGRLAPCFNHMAEGLEARETLARGLHDSLAQGLNFLNLQLQMLEESMRHGRQQEAAGIVPQLRAGVQDCYEDIRALLHHSRGGPDEQDLAGALRKIVDRFRADSGLDVRFSLDGAGGRDISRDEQLQVLFIVQEALSNIRRHARASKVLVRVSNRHDFSVQIGDNGAGFDCAAMSGCGNGHVGLRTMRERARHIDANLSIESRPGAGTTIHLHLAPGPPRAT